MIKIAYIIDTIESPTAGTEKQLLMLIRHLDRSKFQPYLCVLRKSEWLEKEFELCPLFVADIYSFKRVKGLMGIRSLSKFLRKEGIDIVQTHFRDASIAGILAAKMAGVNVIIGTRRNQGYWLTPSDKIIQTFLDKRVTFYIANSQNTKQWQMETEGVAADRIQVIHNGFDFSVFETTTKNARQVIRTELNIPTDAPVVTIVANLRSVKDHATFLKAAQLVVRKIPEAYFLVVGEGPERPALEELCKVLDLQSQVKFLGKRTDIPAILRASDIGALSSKSESFSNAVVEYMAAGLPVVATDVGGVREAVDEGINGFIISVGDSTTMGKRILELLGANTLNEIGQENCQRCVERFMLTSMVEKSANVYERSLQGTNSW